MGRIGGTSAYELTLYSVIKLRLQIRREIFVCLPSFAATGCVGTNTLAANNTSYWKRQGGGKHPLYFANGRIVNRSPAAHPLFLSHPRPAGIPIRLNKYLHV